MKIQEELGEAKALKVAVKPEAVVEMKEVPFTLSSSDLDGRSPETPWTDYYTFKMANGLSLLFSFSYEIQPDSDGNIRMSLSLDLEGKEKTVGKKVPVLVWLRGIGGHCEPFGDNYFWLDLDYPLFLGSDQPPIIFHFPAQLVRPLQPTILFLGLLNFTFLEEDSQGLNFWKEHKFPPRVIAAIFHLLPLKDRLSLSRVCHEGFLASCDPKPWADVKSLEVTGNLVEGRKYQVSITKASAALLYLALRGAPITSLELVHISRLSDVKPAVNFFTQGMSELKSLGIRLKGLAVSFLVDDEECFTSLVLFLNSLPSLERLYLGPFVAGFGGFWEQAPLEYVDQLGEDGLPALRTLCLYPTYDDISDVAQLPVGVARRLEALLVHVGPHLDLTVAPSPALVEFERCLEIAAPSLHRFYRYPHPLHGQGLGTVLVWATDAVSAMELARLQHTAFALLTPHKGPPRRV